MLLSLVVLTCPASAQAPPPREGDFVIKNFQFKSGETLPELRIHYLTLGSPARDAQGHVTNAVLILHGTGGTGRQFLSPQFASVLYGAGRAARHDALLRDPARRHRPRALEQAERRTAHALPALRLRRHGARAVPAGDRAPRRRAPAARDGHLDGRHAHVGVGRDLPRLHGRADAARLPAGRDRRAQSPVARR